MLPSLAASYRCDALSGDAMFGGNFLQHSSVGSDGSDGFCGQLGQMMLGAASRGTNVGLVRSLDGVLAPRDVSPSPAVQNARDRAVGNVVCGGNLVNATSIRSDGVYVAFRQLGVACSLTAIRSSIANLVSGIRGLGSPAQIANLVIRWVVVEVAALGIFRRLSSVSKQDKPVNECGPLPCVNARRDAESAVISYVRAQYAPLGSTAQPIKTIQRADSTQSRRFVIGVSGNWLPNFTHSGIV